jgi:2-methylcitrate dehydratase PrpD
MEVTQMGNKGTEYSRRQFVKTAGLVSMGAALIGCSKAQEPEEASKPVTPAQETEVTSKRTTKAQEAPKKTFDVIKELAEFVVHTHYKDLPQEVIHAAKYLLLDSIGCGLSSVTTDRGKMSITLARKMGGPPEASIIGIADKVSTISASFVNGELINSTDYDALMPGGHVPPYVLPPSLALAESKNCSGKDLLLAIALGLEIAGRVPAGIKQQRFTGKGAEAKFSWGMRGGQAYSNFGAAAGAAKLLSLDCEKTRNALGISGHLCQVLTHVKFSFSDYRHLTKYGMPGWQNTGGIMASLLAEMGYPGDTTVFDGDYGFFQFCGYEGEVDLEAITQSIGEEWNFTKITYKPYPCCRMLHGGIDCLYRIIEKNHIRPEEIESIEVKGHPTIELPCFTHKEVNNILDAQFNAAYVFSVVAHGVKIGPEWQDDATMHDPKIRELMKRVKFSGHPEFVQRIQKNKHEQIYTVDVVARSERFHEETLSPSGVTGTPGAMSDSDLEKKFRHNASRILTQEQIDKAVNNLLNIEALSNVSNVMETIC